MCSFNWKMRTTKRSLRKLRPPWKRQKPPLKIIGAKAVSKIHGLSGQRRESIRRTPRSPQRRPARKLFKRTYCAPGQNARDKKPSSRQIPRLMQKVEAAIADEQRFAAQAASREADLTQARTLLHSNELAVEAERRSKAVLESQGMQLLADLHAKQAGFAVSQVNLGYTKILAPADGAVGERQVRPGQLVSPGTQVITFVENTRWVQANFRETQLTNIRIGDTAEIRIDVYPGQVIQGRVLQIAPASGSQFALLPPDNATGNFTKVVQRVPVKIGLDDSALTSQLRPGLSVVVKVRTRK